MNSPLRGLSWLTMVALLASCASTEFSIPPVSRTTDGSHRPGRIIWHDLLTDTPEQTRVFYGELFGWEFDSLEGVNYTLIRHEGDLIGGMVDQNKLPTTRDVSQWVVLMSVTDVFRATTELGDAGGTVFTPPTSLGERGTISVVADPQGAVLALLETRDGDPPDGKPLPLPGRFLWDELWTDDVDAAAGFYARLAPFNAEAVELATEPDIEYRVLTAGERPRAGIRTKPVAEATPLWVSFLRVADEAALADILSRVETLGGQVLLPATHRPAGGMVAVITGPSGAGVALQTWAPAEILAEGREVR